MSNTNAVRLGFAGILLFAIGVSSAFAAPASEAPVEAAAAEPEELPAGKYSTVTPKIYVTLSQYESETGNRITSFGEAPALAALVAAGELPPVADRLPDEPLVIEPLERIGTYGGDLKALASGARAVDVDTRRPRVQMLVQYDLKEILPNIPLAYEFSDDASVLTFHLRNGMRWSDGEPLTSADFLFWYEDVASNAELTPANRGIWRPGGELVTVEAVDDLTVRFRFAVPHPLILHFMSMKRSDSRSFPVDPKHYLSQFHIKYNPKAGDLAKEQGHDTWVELFRAHDVRNVQDDMDFPRLTPWVIDSVDSVGNHYFARNPYFWKIDTAGNQLPYMDRQVRVVIENQEVANLRSMAGEVHYSSFYLTLENYPLYKESEAKGNYRTVLMVNPRSSIQAYQLNLTYNEDPVLRELFNDIRFRQAMSLALNRDQINEVALLGRAIPRAWSVDPSNPFYEDWMGNYFTDYDPDRANAILDEIGLKWDADGEFRLRPDGKRLDIILEYRPTEGPKATINQLASNHWKAIGVNVIVKEGSDELVLTRMRANQMQMSSHHYGRNTGHGMFTEFPGWFAPPWFGSGRPWAQWYASGGEQGERPPDDVLHIYEVAEELAKEPAGTERWLELGRDIAGSNVRGLYSIGTVGITFQPAIFHSSLVNAPREGVYAADFDFFSPYLVEQFSF